MTRQIPGGLWETVYPRIRSFARHCYSTYLSDINRGQVDLADLEAEGVAGCMQAWRTFDPSRNVEFEYFAKQRIEGAMIGYVRRLPTVPVGPRAWQRVKQLAAAERELKVQGAGAGDAECALRLGWRVEQIRETRGLSFQMEQLDQTRADDADHPHPAVELAGPAECSPEDEANRQELADLMREALNQLDARQRTLVLGRRNDLTLRQLGELWGITPQAADQQLRQAYARLRAWLQEQGYDPVDI